MIATNVVSATGGSIKKINFINVACSVGQRAFHNACCLIHENWRKWMIKVKAPWTHHHKQLVPPASGTACQQRQSDIPFAFLHLEKCNSEVKLKVAHGSFEVGSFVQVLLPSSNPVPSRVTSILFEWQCAILQCLFLHFRLCLASVNTFLNSSTWIFVCDLVLSRPSSKMFWTATLTVEFSWPPFCFRRLFMREIAQKYVEPLNPFERILWIGP